MNTQDSHYRWGTDGEQVSLAGVQEAVVAQDANRSILRRHAPSRDGARFALSRRVRQPPLVKPAPRPTKA